MLVVLIKGDPDVINLILQTGIKTMVAHEGYYQEYFQKAVPLFQGQFTEYLCDNLDALGIYGQTLNNKSKCQGPYVRSKGCTIYTTRQSTLLCSHKNL